MKTNGCQHSRDEKVVDSGVLTCFGCLIEEMNITKAVA